MDQGPILSEVLTVVRRHKPAARAIGVELVGIVGSVARGDAGPDSDVDIVYDVIGKASLWDLGGLLMELQDALGRKVDLVDREMMKPERRAFMERTLAPL
jgi:hypothetical protein